MCLRLLYLITIRLFAGGAGGARTHDRRIMRIRFFPLRQGLAGAPGTNVFAQEVLAIMVTSACLAGAAASIRELVKERPIYERERAAGLSSRGYLVSKLALLSVISVVQSVAMVLLGLADRRMPAHGSRWHRSLCLSC
jgi:hypothetical protein